MWLYARHATTGLTLTALEPHSQPKWIFGFQGQLFDAWAEIEWQLYSSVSTRNGPLPKSVNGGCLAFETKQLACPEAGIGGRQLPCDQ